MASITSPSRMEEAIMKAVRLEVTQIIQEETAKAQANVERRVREIADKLALSILSQYRIYDNGMGIVIEVKKKPEDV